MTWDAPRSSFIIWLFWRLETTRRWPSQAYAWFTETQATTTWRLSPPRDWLTHDELHSTQGISVSFMSLFHIERYVVNVCICTWWHFYEKLNIGVHFELLTGLIDELGYNFMTSGCYMYRFLLVKGNSWWLRTLAIRLTVSTSTRVLDLSCNKPASN